MINKEFVITHLNNRIKSLTEERKELICQGIINSQTSSKYWVISGIIGGLEEVLELFK